MNYLKIKISFWQLRRSKRITSLQADLFDFLLQESMGRGYGLEWENPFECSNKLICAGIGISEDAITDARNRLKQLGLIDFSPGQRNKKSPSYELLYPFKTGNNTGNTAGNNTGNTAGNNTGNNPNLYKEKQNRTETKHSSSIEEELRPLNSSAVFPEDSGWPDATNPQPPHCAPPPVPPRPPKPPASGFRKPTLEQVEDYFRERCPEYSPDMIRKESEAFHDYYTSNGWKVGGKSPMKDWQASVRNWLKNDYNNASTHAQSNPTGQQRAGQSYPNGNTAGQARSRGASIEDLQRLKRRTASPDPEQHDISEAEILD